MDVQKRVAARIDAHAGIALALGTAAVVGGGLLAAIDSAAPFAHGAWLAAYLVLVAGVAQFALELGQVALRETPPPARQRGTQLVLWNAGNAAVPAGVLLNAAGLVWAGSALLLASLAGFAAGTGLGPRGARRGAIAYHLIVAGLAISVAIGCLLAGAEPAQAGALLPERGGSPNADRIASLYTLVLVLAGIVFAGVTIALATFLIRYRARRNPIPAQIHGNTRLEIAWTFAAFALIAFIATFSLTKLSSIEHADAAPVSPRTAALLGLKEPGDALHIRVTGQQYIWRFDYPNGAFSYHELVAPVGVTVKLDIDAVDVAHSWWIPKLGGKFDAIPGYESHTWFRLERPGVYRGQCAELCGRNHADMTAKVRGVTPAAYAAWVARQKRLIGAAR